MWSSRWAMWDLPSHPFLWAWPGGVGWEHHGPSCPSSLSRREWRGGDHRPDKPWAHKHQRQHTEGRQQLCRLFLPHLSLNLHDSLLRQSARLNHGDSFSGEISKNFLMKTDVRSCSNEPVTTLRTPTCSSLGSGLAAVVVNEGNRSKLTSWLIQKEAPPTWSSSDNSVIFFTSHLLATMIRGCRQEVWNENNNIKHWWAF